MKNYTEENGFKYYSFHGMYSVDGIVKSFSDIVGIDIDSVKSDIENTFQKEVEILQYGIK